MFTLEQALAFNKRKMPPTNRQDPRTIKRWYEQRYYMKADGGWYMTVGSKEYVKYTTA